jgi:16S rRNA A1518/A1519 N6-dimethyltransferase RsmA/KsgA/DIM1 with predicted DNA glycosylase/AP lyase activity
LRFHPPAVDVGERSTFERLVRGVFTQRRKTLLNALAPVAAAFDRSAVDLIARAGVDGSKRPQASDSRSSPGYRELCYSFPPKLLSLPELQVVPAA